MFNFKIFLIIAGIILFNTTVFGGTILMMGIGLGTPNTIPLIPCNTNLVLDWTDVTGCNLIAAGH